MKYSSRKTIFINTSPPDERVVLLKPQSQIDAMDDEDDDIESKGLLSRYAERPKSMNNITLAEFASSYEKKAPVFTSRNRKLCKTTPDSLLPEPQVRDEEDIEDDDRINPTPDEEQQPSTCSQDEELQYRQRRKPAIIRTVHFNPDADPENYYRELLMLYSPWRDEQNDIKSNCSSFFSRYQQIQEQIEGNRQQFEPFRTAVQLAETFIAEQPDLEDSWDTVAPSTEDMDRQDRERYQSGSSNPQEQYDIGQDLGMRLSSVEEDLHSYHELPDDEFRHHMRLLNQQQMEFVYDIIHQIKTQQEPVYHFLSGGAGVGKSFVTKALYQMILKFFNRKAGDDFTTPKVLLLAPTGKAAYHIHGNTIHSALRIPVNQLLQHKPLDSSSLNSLQNLIGNVQVIFIDEISMVGYRMFNCIHQRLIELKQCNKDFGGVSIIAVGDLFQLAPVRDSLIFKAPQKNYLPLSTNLWEQHFKMTELVEIMRQRDNKVFAELLNRLREGNHTDRDIRLLKSNVISKTDPEYRPEFPHIFVSNEKVNDHNSKVFKGSTTTKCTVHAKDRVMGNYSPEVSDRILESFYNNEKDAPQLTIKIEIAEGLKYEMTLNMDTQDGLINGAGCELKKIHVTNSEQIRHASGILWVCFDDERTGQALRRKKKHLYAENINSNWTPIEPTSRQYTAGYKGQAKVQRVQFPLRPAAAKTVHKSQGDTLDNIVVDLTCHKKWDHMHYVALSRVTSMNGLNILNLQEDKISVNSDVEKEMERLRLMKPETSLKFLCSIKQKFKIIFLNANSLHRHIEDVRKDFNFKSADIACFCETRFQHTDSDESTSLPRFYTYRQDSTTQQGNHRPAYGLALYSKRKFPANFPKNFNSKSVEMTILKLKKPDITLVVVYKPPKSKVDFLLQSIKKIHDQYLRGAPSIFIGDFNINWSEENPGKNKIYSLFQSLSYTQLIDGPTTDDNTTIDLIFTNLPESSIESGTLEVYYSPHKPVWISV